MPKWHPDSDVVMHSGNLWNPFIRSSNLGGCTVHSPGCKRLFWCCKSKQVAGSISRSGEIGIPLKILFANGIVPDMPSQSERGGQVNGVSCACQKCMQLHSSNYLSISAGSWIVCQVNGLSMVGTSKCVRPQGVLGFKSWWTVVKHLWVSSACFKPKMSFLQSLFFVALAAWSRVLRNSLHFACASCWMVWSCWWTFWCHCNIISLSSRVVCAVVKCCSIFL